MVVAACKLSGRDEEAASKALAAMHEGVLETHTAAHQSCKMVRNQHGETQRALLLVRMHSGTQRAPLLVRMQSGTQRASLLVKQRSSRRTTNGAEPVKNQNLLGD